MKANGERRNTLQCRPEPAGEVWICTRCGFDRPHRFVRNCDPPPGQIRLGDAAAWTLAWLRIRKRRKCRCPFRQAAMNGWLSTAWLGRLMQPA